MLFKCIFLLSSEDERLKAAAVSADFVLSTSAIHNRTHYSESQHVAAESAKPCTETNDADSNTAAMDNNDVTAHKKKRKRKHQLSTKEWKNQRKKQNQTS